MDYERTLILMLLFLFSVFLFPQLSTGIEAISGSEPLKPMLSLVPYAWLITLLGLMGYSVYNHD